MAAKSILEADGKAILNYHLTRAPVIKPSPLPAAATHNPPSRVASLYFPEDADIRGILDQAETTYPWLLQKDAKFVAKPDQLIKRRGKSGLLALNKTWSEAKEWIAARAGKEQQVETVKGYLRQFLVEPFVAHPEDTEYYININSVRDVSCAFVITYMLKISTCIKKKLVISSAFKIVADTSRRETGFCSHTKVVSTLAMSTQKPKSCLFQSISQSTHPTMRLQARC